MLNFYLFLIFIILVLFYVSMEEELNESFERLLLESGSEQSDDEDTSLSNACVYPVSESDDESDEEVEEDERDDIWDDEFENQNNWTFSDDYSIDANVFENCSKPIDFYELFMTDVWVLMCNETNLYAFQKGASNWIDSDVNEMRKFFGLCLQMGIVRLPTLRNYWSKDAIFGGQPIGGQAMNRTRFEALLNNLHLADNSKNDGTLFKIRPLLIAFLKLDHF